MFKVAGGLSEVDRYNLTDHTVRETQKPQRGQIVHRGELISFKKVETRSGREWKCPFCTCSNSSTLRQCKSCGARDGRFGSLDFAYKTPTKKMLDSSGYDALKEAVRREFSS